MNFQVVEPILSSSLLNQVIALDHNFMSYSWSEKQWREINDENYKLFVALTDHVVGFSLYKLSREESLAHLLKIVIAPTEQGQMTTAFFAMQNSLLRSLGFSRIYLEVSENNLRAQGFYKKMGFELLHKAKAYYTDGASALMMELKL